MITHVAIRFDGKTYSLPRPNRHHDVIRLIAEETGAKTVDAHGDDQGFLDEQGTYYRRGQALRHALEHNQIKDSKVLNLHLNMLFSEDLW